MLFASLLLATIVTAQSTATSEIIVDAEASLEVQPDVFVLLVRVVETAETRAEALSASETVMSTMRDTLPSLAELDELGLKTESAGLDPIRDPSCLSNTSYEGRMSCPITGWRFGQSLTLVGSPPEAAGNVLSMAIELGATNADFRRFDISDRQSALREVEALAVEAAQNKAERLARAAGAELGALTRLQAAGDMSAYDPFDLGEVVVMESRAREVQGPEIELALDPAPIELTARVVATFSLEP